LRSFAAAQDFGARLLGKNFPALLCQCGANVLHCRSTFYLCFEHVDNLGGTTSRPETGLLISSDFVNRTSRTCRTLVQSAALLNSTAPNTTTRDVLLLKSTPLVGGWPRFLFFWGIIADQEIP